MRLFVFALTVLLIAIPATAQEEVEGNVSGRWTEEDSPYIVVGDIHVRENNTLTIDPGVSVLFEEGYTFTVYGRLNAVGTEEDSIEFSWRERNERWNRLIMNGDDESVISYCVFRGSESFGNWQQVSSRGGALYIDGCDIEVSHCFFTDNRSSGEGGGLFVFDSEADIIYNIFDGNVAEMNAGAIAVFEANPHIAYNFIVENRAGYAAGGILTRSARPVIEYNIVMANIAEECEWGGGMYFDTGSQPAVRYNLVARNNGGGVFAGSNAAPLDIDDFTNNTIVGNSGRCGILLYRAHLTMTNCIVWDHDDPIWINGGMLRAFYSDIQNAENEGIQIGDGVIDEDPMFLNPDRYDFNLTFESPCINAGDPDSPPDPDGTRVDMGCFFFGSFGEIEIIPEEIDFGYVGLNDEQDFEWQIVYSAENEDAPDITLLFEPSEDWLSVDPVEEDFAAGDTVDITVVATIPEDMELGVNSAEIVVSIRRDEDEQEFELFNIPVTLFAVEGFGSLIGTVTDAETDEPLPEVVVHLEGIPHTATTDEQGEFAVDPIPAWDYTATVDVVDYIPYGYEFTIEPDEETVLDIDLRYAICSVDPDHITVIMMPDQSVQRNLTIVNTGNGPLDFWLEKEFERGGDAEPWELRQTINAGDQCEDTRLQGVAFTGENFYVTGGNNGEQRGLVHIFSRDGEYIRSYDQFRDSFWGLRDMTYDGELLWSGDETAIYGFTPEGELVTEFDGPFDVNRSIAWDEDRNLLWVCDIGTEIIGVDREGDEVATLPVNESFDIFGMATFPEDSNDCNLYAFGMDVRRNNLVYKINPDEEEWIFVTNLETDENMMAGGLCITGRWDPMSWVFVGLTRGRQGADDEISIWHLSTRSMWLDYDQDEGIVEADRSEVIPITFNSVGFPANIELTADLIIRHNGRGDDVTIPIILQTTNDGVEPNEPSPPTVFALDNPYPNPFNRTIRIGFSLPNECDVRLELFDLSGRKVKSLLDGRMTAGRHSISFHSTDLAGGVYLLRLKNDSQQSLRKLVLIK